MKNSLRDSLRGITKEGSMVPAYSGTFILDRDALAALEYIRRKTGDWNRNRVIRWALKAACLRLKEMEKNIG